MIERYGASDRAEKVNKKVLDTIADHIGNIKYGEIVITIHDSRVVQIEKKEKNRFF